MATETGLAISHFLEVRWGALRLAKNALSDQLAGVGGDLDIYDSPP